MLLEFGDRMKGSIDFFFGIVVHATEPNHSLGFRFECGREWEGVVVSMPGADGLFCEFFGGGMGVEAMDLECEGGGSSGGVLWVFDPVEFDMWKFAESLEELRDTFGFDLLDPLKRVIEALGSGGSVGGIE